eukprot:952590-Prymnesium_polylepis.1
MYRSADSDTDEDFGKPTCRASRKLVAQETMQILTSGGYTNHCGSWVDIAEATRACIEGTTMRLPQPKIARDGSTRSTEVVEEGTLRAASRLHAQGFNVCALNFASAKNPGGGFLGGAEAQEENIARSSALYTSLTSPEAVPFYTQHRSQRDPLYTHELIYSPRVPVIRDDTSGRLLDVPWPCSFVTAPAPNAGVARKQGIREALISQALEERAHRVLRAAH